MGTLYLFLTMEEFILHDLFLMNLVNWMLRSLARTNHFIEINGVLPCKFLALASVKFK